MVLWISRARWGPWGCRRTERREVVAIIGQSLEFGVMYIGEIIGWQRCRIYVRRGWVRGLYRMDGQMISLQ